MTNEELTKEIERLKAESDLRFQRMSYEADRHAKVCVQRDILKFALIKIASTGTGYSIGHGARKIAYKALDELEEYVNAQDK